MVRALSAAGAALLLAAFAGTQATGRTAAAVANRAQLVSVGYGSMQQLEVALRTEGATAVRSIPSLHVVEARLPEGGSAASLRRRPGIRFVHPAVARLEAAAQTSALAAAAAGPEWQLRATHEDLVPDSVLRAAATIRIAVVDTGADLGAPDLAQKHPLVHDVLTGGTEVSDANGHGTFVASLAAGAVGAGFGMDGSGGDAQLLVVRAGQPDGSFTDVDEAAGIVYAVDHGARIINLSLGGTQTSTTERRAIAYATSHGVLVIAPVGNEYAQGNPVEYPAALLQPVGSDGSGGAGLAVAASTSTGGWAPFSNTGSTVSLAAPGQAVFGAVSRLSSPRRYPRAAITGAAQGLYGYASGTSFAAPQVAGAAALVWAADPSLPAAEVARILKETASGSGRWTPQLGFGVIDVAAAVARAQADASAAGA